MLRTPYEYEVRSTYANGVTTSIRHSDGDRPMGTKWIGDKGWIWVKRGQSKASNSEWVKKGFNPGEKKVYHSANHYRNFADCVKSRKPCICPAETSFRSITPGFLCYAAEAVGRKIKWDPKTEQIIGDEEANRLVNQPMRAPWRL